MNKNQDILEQAEKALSRGAVPQGPSEDLVRQTLEEIEQTKPKTNPLLERILKMKTPLKLTAAAVMLIAAILSLTLSDKLITPAYALEQTVQALNAMRSIHARIYFPGYSESALVWAEFHENGQIKSLRISQPEMLSGDGAKECVLKNGKAQVWSKKTNILYLIPDKENASRTISSFFQDLDPKLLMQKLEQMQDQGIAQIEIEQPDQIDQPIIVTATLTEEDPLLGHQVIALVDQATKRVLSLETFKGDGTLAHKNGYFEKEDFNRIEFFDYNQSFEENIFTLNVPDDTLVIDRSTRKVGLSPGQMSIEDTAVEVVKRFLQSIIDEDCETAGLMYGGIPAEKIKESLGKQAEGEILRVLSIGEATVHPNPDYKDKAFVVPCTIEFTKNGQIEQKTFHCVVREVDGQPGQWAICGGI